MEAMALIEIDGLPIENGDCKMFRWENHRSLWWFLSESGHDRFIYYYIVLVKGGHFPYHNCCSKKRSTRNRFENTSLTHGDIAGSNRAGFNKQQMGFLPQPKWRGKLRKNWVNPQKPNRTNLQHLWSIVIVVIIIIIIIIKIMIVLMLPHDMPETRTTMTLRKNRIPIFCSSPWYISRKSALQWVGG